MDNREVSVWLDNRWCGALEAYLGRPIEELLRTQAVLLIQTLPKEQRDAIAAEIQREDQQMALTREANRRFSVFSVKDNDCVQNYLAEHRESFFLLGTRLRQYLRSDTPDSSKLIPEAETLSLEQFERYTAEMINGSPRVTGVFSIDLDDNRVSTLDPKDGWHTYQFKDVSTAVYFAAKPQTQWKKNSEVFQQRLEGKELKDVCHPVFIRGENELPVNDLSFQDEISQIGNRLNFYLLIRFDPDKVFGTYVETLENDDYLNLYADYSLKTGKVLDTLEVYLVRGDGSELNCQYRLTPKEQEALRSCMDDYCREQMGVSLEEAREQYMAEEAAIPSSPKHEDQGPVMEQTMM